MKTYFAPLCAIAALTVSLSTIGLTGCTKSDSDAISAKTGEVAADTKAAIGKGWDNVKSFAFDKRGDFQTSAKAMTSKMDAKMSDLRANYSDAKATASRKAAMAELKDSEADYKAKLDALGTATADTWDSAKQNVISSWDHLEASYHKARAD